jgi:hypothetical protein
MRVGAHPAFSLFLISHEQLREKRRFSAYMQYSVILPLFVSRVNLFI